MALFSVVFFLTSNICFRLLYSPLSSLFRPGFAVWASNSVGDNIRNETMLVLVKEWFKTLPAWMQNIIDELGPDWIIKIPFVQVVMRLL